LLSNLLLLRQQLDGLLSVIETVSTLPQIDNQSAGGCDELPQSNHLADAARDKTEAGYSHSGADTAPSTAEKRKGS
jgi:hypothetical protein